MNMIKLDIYDDERVAVVTLDDPDRRNALNLEMVSEIGLVFDRLEGDDNIGAVVVTGSGSAFCAGAALGDLQKASADDFRAIYEGFLRVGRSTLPTVAAINGPAVGAGMNLALVCDVRLAATRARFDTRFIDLGLHPGGGHTWMLRNAIGPQAAAAMVLFGQILDGTQAEQAGLVWRCVDDEALADKALQLAARAASGPKLLLQEVKTTMSDMATVTTHAEAIERELKPQVWSVSQPFFAERLAAIQARVKRS
ncbi:MAG: enoyl-CoA hydratase [Acidimicrobiales bacterium]